MAPVGRIKLPNQPPLTLLCRLEICVLARVSEGVGSVPALYPYPCPCLSSFLSLQLLMMASPHNFSQAASGHCRDFRTCWQAAADLILHVPQSCSAAAISTAQSPQTTACVINTTTLPASSYCLCWPPFSCLAACRCHI